MTTRWPRGSAWRKWDLHLHAPGTKLNDQFAVADGSDIWDAYCRALHASDVQVFGIADYFSADGYFSALQAYQARYPDSPKLFLPNVELRTNDVVNKQQEEVNVHLLFNPFRPHYAEEIRSFLDVLKTNKTAGGGRHVKTSELKHQHDFASATTTREFIREALSNVYGSTADLLDYVLIITAANNDGIRPERGKQRKLLITDELDKFSNAFFGHAGNVDYFLRPDRGEDKGAPTMPKPVLSGCDAHSLSDLEERLGQVASDAHRGIEYAPTWIKADLTYEGLKQIIFEPGNRVFIGAEPDVERRVRDNKTRYIESVHITNVDGYKSDAHGAWFHQETIALNKELVAIIGNKGSGKSAITDIIGLLGNSHNQLSTNTSGAKGEELFSFLNRNKFLKGGCASHFQATLNWYEGAADTKRLDAQAATNLPERVEYLPQKYLERVCANIADDEFRTTLNSVIFRYVKPQDRFRKGNLDELIQYRTQQANEEILLKKQDLRSANGAVVAAEKRLTEDYRKQLEEKIRQKKEDLEAHGKVIPTEMSNPNTGPDAAAAEPAELLRLSQQLSALEQQIEQLQSEQITVSASAEELRQFRQAIERAVQDLAGLETKHEALLAAVGLNFSQIVALNADYTALDTVIGEKVLRLMQIETLLAAPNAITSRHATDIGADASSLVGQKATIEAQKAELVERLGRPAREYQQYIGDLKLWNDRERELRGDPKNPGAETLLGLQDELQKVNTVYRENLRTLRAERERVSKEVFRKKRDLTRFYDTVKQAIDDEIVKCRSQLGEYNLTIEAGLRFASSFFDEFLKFINQSAIGSFRGQEEGRAMLRRFTDAVDNWEDEGQVFRALESIVEALHADMRDEDLGEPPVRDVFKQMKGQKTPQELYDYLFGFDYLEPKYDLKVDGKDLSELSPGERGGLLLIFYLMLDRQDIPLVIDQPEDNLDNKSVYEVLVTFIKQAKKRRQIILVTHNPNLAVVADAEQIIHVSIDKKEGKHDFDFFSGAIEDPRINQTVIDILEGTLPAFDNRRLKYRRVIRPMT
ncbi:TrlF family AAA-like ATPase [Dyella sp. ASV21]|uniref:TrlF family AAA-like ATPase n=1 Tax=Dyella sp. ASV21 TaxID=2795114 RepID=UPI0018EB804C|nr:AAA family ATPase [Dyella sp. ASV21]